MYMYIYVLCFQVTPKNESVRGRRDTSGNTVTFTMEGMYNSVFRDLLALSPGSPHVCVFFVSDDRENRQSSCYRSSKVITHIHNYVQRGAYIHIGMGL